MALVFHRRLAIPLWAVAFFTVTLTAPAAATLALIVALGIAVIAFTIPGLVIWLRGSPSAAQILSNGQRRTRRAATVVVAGVCVSPLDTPSRRTAQDALDLVRMDDGGWQMARPPAP